MGTPRRRLLAAILVAGLAVTGCQAAPSASPLTTPSVRSTTATTCSELAERIVDAVQDYVDGFAGVTATGIADSVGASRTEFVTTTSALRARGESLGCGRDDLADLIRTQLGRLTGGTPVQDAVAGTFRADPLGGVDPSDPGSIDMTVTTAVGLAEALMSAGSGSTIRLAAGTYAFDGPLTLLRPVTLIGAGVDATTITSTSADAALISAADGDLGLVDLTIRHVGTDPASVVAVIAGGYRLERVRVAGALQVDGAGGYGIVLRPAAAALTSSGSSRVLTDVTALDNQGGGIVVGGREQPVITRPVVEGTEGCALCFVEAAAGWVSDAHISRSSVGIRIDDTSAPTVTGADIERPTLGVALGGSGAPQLSGLDITGAVIGVQATAAGSPTLTGGSIRDSKEIGVRLSGTSRATLTGLSIRGTTKIGVAVIADAVVTISGGEVSTTGEAGVVWAERASGTASAMMVRGANLGIQLSGTASATLLDVVVDRSAGAAVLLSDTSAGTFTRMKCGTGASGAVATEQSAKLTLADSPTCSVIKR